MADWPEVEELAQVLNVDDVTTWQTTLDRVLASAIAQVKLDVGNWDEDDDEPTDKMAQAALRMGELIAQRADGTSLDVGEAFRQDPTYLALLKGSRRVFGVA